MNKPFGETLVEQHSLTEDYETPFKFNGKELDAETGLYYYGARYYDARTSIWLSVDPLAGKTPNFNPYAYCEQNPVNLTDPTGMSVEGDDTFIYKNKNGKVTKTEVVHTGENTPNRLFVQDASANNKTENRMSHNGSYFEIQMIPTSAYNESDFTVKMSLGLESQFDKDRRAYQFGGDYSDKNYMQRLGESLWDDTVTTSDMTILLMPRGGEGPGGTIAAEEKLAQYSYHPRVRARGVQDPVSHNFPYSFDEHILNTAPIPKSNGYNMYQLEGTMNGKNGVFEIGVTKEFVIDHRFFRPTRQ